MLIVNSTRDWKQDCCNYQTALMQILSTRTVVINSAPYQLIIMARRLVEHLLACCVSRQMETQE